MITVISFLFFYLTIYFVGRGVISFFKLKNDNIYGIPINIFYPIVALFYLGNLSLVFNFFTKITYQITIFSLVIPLLLNFLNLQKIKTFLNLKNLSLYIGTPLVLGISSANINLAYDAGLYHLNHQNWLRSEKIVFGLSNNHMRFGYSSIIEYINVNFWFNENFLLLHFTNLIFMVVFFQVIYIFLFTDFYKFSLSVLIYGFLDNFGFNGGKNGFIEVESIAKQDTPFAIMFILSTFLLFQLYKEDLRKNTRTANTIIFIFCLLSVQLRLLGFINLIFFLIILIIKFDVIKSLRIILRENYLLSFLGVLFVLKNLITSSCLFYPVKITCFESFVWTTGNYSSPGAESDLLANFHIALRFSNLDSWFSQWMSKDINNTVFKNLIITFFVILIFNLLFKLLNKEKLNRKNIFYFIYTIFSLFIWLITAPSIRMGVGIFLTLVLVISIIFQNKDNKLIKNNVFIFTSIYFIVLGLVPQTNNYFSLINNLTSGEIRKIETPVINYTDNKVGYGVLPEKGDQCWINLECVRNPSVIKNEYLSYVIFKR